MRRAFISLLAIAVALTMWFVLSFAKPVLAENTMTLKIYQGYMFDSKSVVESSSKADLCFIPARQFAGVGRLSAEHIREFKSIEEVKAAKVKDAENWKDYVMAPAPGSYLVVKTKAGKYYLLRVVAFENQGKARSYWRLKMEWEYGKKPGNSGK